VRLTHDHKPEHEDEEKRIREAGGHVIDNRLGGVLGVSRGIGDFYLWPFISVKPFTQKYNLPKHPDAFVVVCCDGVWDELSDAEAVALVLQMKSEENLHKVATKLRDTAFLLGSDDNISTLIIKWDKKVGD